MDDPMSAHPAAKATTKSNDRVKQAPLLKPLYLELDAVSFIVGLAIATIQRLVRDGSFPKPRQLSNRRVAWLFREIEEWAEQRPISDLPPPSNTSRTKIDER
ncbi:AlpA family transcriptional regulator [uncultured Massilia sp.]|uniref:helix-turn-helix transcriptional regulator n=1 Tax=uncultured Massilia sp. TaxID=169973 RepID=UPI0025CC8631|nr:AlpA family phage regulatory protein [uncultured Massilia sp.]